MEKSVKKTFQDGLKSGWTRKGKTEALNEFNGRLLEIGCGSQLSYEPEEGEIYGVDLVHALLALLKKRFPKVNAIVADAEKLPFRESSIDAVVTNDLLHHLVGENPEICRRNIENAIREMRRIMKASGFILINELTVANALFSTLIFYATLLCAKLHLSIPLIDIHSEVVTYFLSPNNLKRICQNKFRILNTSSSVWILRGRTTEIGLLKLGERTHLTLQSK